MKNQGKIIAIVGAPRSGKSFLARKLAEHYSAKLFLEGDNGSGVEKFPDWLAESIAEDKWHLARQLWFRSQLAKSQLVAQQERELGRVVIMDTFWMSTSLYVETTLSGWERDLMREVIDLDRNWLSLPDLVIWLKISEAGIRRFLASGGRAFDQSEAYLQNTVLPVNDLHAKFFTADKTGMRVLTVEREALDFANNHDFLALVEQVESRLR